jgi:hypothetical protein
MINRKVFSSRFFVGLFGHEPSGVHDSSGSVHFRKCPHAGSALSTGSGFGSPAAKPRSRDSATKHEKTNAKKKKKSENRTGPGWSSAANFFGAASIEIHEKYCRKTERVPQIVKNQPGSDAAPKGERHARLGNLERRTIEHFSNRFI